MTNDALPRLYFCFPYRGVGGVSLLFLRFAEFMQSNKLADCALIDYQDGFMASHVTNPDITLLKYEDSGSKVLVPNGVTAVFQSMTPWSIYPGLQFEPDVKFLFWNCHPFNLIPSLPGFRTQMQRNPKMSQFIYQTALRGYIVKMRRFTDLLMQRSALVFMDEPNIKTTERFLNLRLKHPNYMPIATYNYPAVSHMKRAPRSLEDQIRVTWLGRIVDFKFFPLLNFLQKLNMAQNQISIPIKINIVGSGGYLKALQKKISKLKNLEVNFLNNVPPPELASFLIDTTDLIIGMGTSLLEGARIGIPGILLDASYGPVPKNYKFKFLHESDNYSLGEIIDAEDYSEAGRSIEELLVAIRDDFAAESARTRKYFNENHEIETAASKLLIRIQESTLTFKELNTSGLLKKPLAYMMLLVLRGHLNKLAGQNI